MTSVFFFLLLYPLSSFSDSTEPNTTSSAPISPTNSTPKSISGSSADVVASSNLTAVAAPTLPPTGSPNSNYNGPNPFISYLVSFTGGKGNYLYMAREFLTAHNQVRATVQEHPFVWDKQLSRFAKRWAEGRRTACRMEHSMAPYGENMFWGSGWSWRAGDAVKEWAKERGFYNPKDNSCAPGRMCGHFTQIIWNSTVRIGCGRSECYNGGVIITCNYDPPGNYVGENPLTASIP